jgi:hypothetical protein
LEESTMSKRNRTARFDIDRAKAWQIMDAAGARQLACLTGPDGGELAMYGTARGVVIVQTFATGGVTHYNAAPGDSWESMREDVTRMMSEPARD